MVCSFSSLAEFASLRAKVFGEFLGASPRVATELFVALNEAVNNALFHGNGGDVSKSVTLSITREEASVVISVKDEGRGYDYNTRLAVCREGLLENGRSLLETGRGLDIIRNCVDRVEFNAAGNEIVFTKALRQE